MHFSSIQWDFNNKGPLICHRTISTSHSPEAGNVHYHFITEKTLSPLAVFGIELLISKSRECPLLEMSKKHQIEDRADLRQKDQTEN